MHALTCLLLAGVVVFLLIKVKKSKNSKLFMTSNSSKPSKPAQFCCWYQGNSCIQYCDLPNYDPYINIPEGN